MSARSRTFRPAVENLETRATPSVNPAATPTPFYDTTWQAYHQQYLTRAESGNANVLFLGDSITQHWMTQGLRTWNAAFAPLGAANFGLPGDQTQNVLWRIENGEFGGTKPFANGPVSAMKPHVVVLMAGTNNLATSSAAEIVGGIAALVHQIRAESPGSKVLLLGILPRGAVKLRNEIASINRALANLDDGKTIRFADPGKTFIRDGSIRPGILPDGLHPNSNGYILMGNVIRPLLRQMLAVPLPTPPPPKPAPAPAPSYSFDWLNGPNNGAVGNWQPSGELNQPWL